MAWTCQLLATVLFASGGLAAQEVEEILDYDVTIDVGDGGVMDVREVLRVRALGQQIRRGIFRDVPTSFPRRFGPGRIEAPFEVRSVTRNGEPEPYSLESADGLAGRRGVRIRIGDRDVFLDDGVHDYAIEYRTSRWIEFGEELDRLYWNVTGNGWGFPVRSATARVRIDGVTTPPDLEAWTGPEGSTASDAEIRWDAADRAAVFAATETLEPGEGLTVRVTFPAGLLDPPTEEQRSEWTRLDWGGWIDSAYVVLLVVAVYLLMWRRVGMDPPPGRMGVTDEPPPGYSPAALGFIEERGYEERLLSAALVSMALKGAVRIVENDDTWTIEKLREPDELEEPLSAEEEALFGELLGARRSISLSRTNHRTLRSAIKSFRSSLARCFEREYFRHNRRWFAAGLAVSVVAFGLLAWRWRFDIHPVALFLGFWLTFWSIGVGTLGYRIVRVFRMAMSGGGPAMWIGFVFLSLFSVPFFAAEIVVSGLLLSMVPVHLVAAAILLGLTNVVFYHLLERPTLKGRGVLDDLDAFRAHLDSASEAAHRAGPRSAEQLGLYERHLPFAIALGAEQRWTETFEGVVGSALTADGSGPALAWYRPRHTGTGPDVGRLASDLGTGLSSRISAMSSPPSSGGGGSSGGGSSGGGGGGGGGGGW